MIIVYVLREQRISLNQWMKADTQVQILSIV